MSVLTVENLSKSFGGVRAVENCSFEVREAKITALIGPNGAGKTTLFNLVNGFQVADRGRIVFRGHDVTTRALWERSRLGMSRTFQISRLFKNLSIRENLMLAIREFDDEFFRIWRITPSQSPFKLFRAIFKRSNGSKSNVDEGAEETAIREMLEFVGLKKDPSLPVTDLSYGEQKLFDLCRALLNPHTLLLFDEPVSGIHPTLREKLKGILRNLKTRGETVFLIEHDMNFVRAVADWVIVMDQGSVLTEGEPEKVLQDKLVLDVYLGTAER